MSAHTLSLCQKTYADVPVNMCTFGVPGSVKSSNPAAKTAVKPAIKPSLAAFVSTVVRTAMAATGRRQANIVAAIDESLTHVITENSWKMSV